LRNAHFAGPDDETGLRGRGQSAGFPSRMNAFASLEKMLDPAHPCFTPETAANILRLPSDPGVQRRVDELSPRQMQAN
jgi:hypothetical protein